MAIVDGVEYLYLLVDMGPTVPSGEKLEKDLYSVGVVDIQYVSYRTDKSQFYVRVGVSKQFDTLVEDLIWTNEIEIITDDNDNWQ